MKLSHKQFDKHLSVIHVFGILKQIQIRDWKEFEQIIFWLKLFDLDYWDVFIGKYLVITMSKMGTFQRLEHSK